MPFKLNRILPIFLILSFTFILFSSGLTKKLVGYHDWNSVVYSSVARSLIGKAETGEFFYQQDYPILLPLSLSFSFLVFGIKEWSVRLVPVVFTFLTSLMIYLLTKKLWTKKEGLIASILYLNTPLIRYFGKIPVHETITPFFALLIFYSYWHWFRKTSFKNYLLLLVSIFLAEQAGWPGYYPVPLITLHYLIFSKRKKLSLVLNWWLVSFLSFFSFLFISFLITKRLPLADLWKIFLIRINYSEDKLSIFTWLDFFKKELLWLRVYLTRILTFLVIGWSLNFVRCLVKKRFKLESIFLIFLALFGSIHLIIFRQLAWFHDYMIIYLFPFLTIAAARVVSLLFKSLKLSYFILLLLLFLMYFESRHFVEALENNLDNYPGYQLGIFAKRETGPKEMVFIGCSEASKMYGVYFYFYANRAYGAGEPSLADFLEEEKNYQRDFRFFVVDWGHNRLSSELTDYLESNYRHQKTGQFQIFDLKDEL